MVLKPKAASKTQPVTKQEEPQSSVVSVNQTPPKTRTVKPRSPARQTRSPARPKSPGRTKSPARAKTPPAPKSPARTPGRAKSPARARSPARTKSPARKSPSRTKQDVPLPASSSTPKIVSPQARAPIRSTASSKSPTRTTRVSQSTDAYFSELVRKSSRLANLDSDSDNAELEQTPEKPQAAVRGRLRQLNVHVEQLDLASLDSKETEPVVTNVVKRFTRSSQSRDDERVVHLKNFDSSVKKLGEFSDEDEITTPSKKAESVEKIDFKQILEFGGWPGALFFTLFTPLAIIGLYITCNEHQCSFTKLPNFKKYLLPTTYFHVTSFLAFVAYAALVAVLSAIPFGGRKITGLPTKQGKFTYVMNGFFVCVVLMTIAGGLEYKGFKVAGFVTAHIFHLLISSLIFGLLLTVYAYIRSFYVPISSLNAHVVGKNVIYGMFMGRELNPRTFGILDLKMYVFRLGVIGSILLDFAYLYNNLYFRDISYSNISNISPTLTLLVSIHLIYFLDSLISEPAWVTSFEVQYEGFGFMGGVGYLIFPFIAASVTKYIADYNVELETWKLVLTTAVFLLGLILFRGSNNQKDAFRKNPYDPALSHLETIPTSKGKKLICSGFWGIVRHPNYLGDILMNLAFASFALSVPPVITGISILLLLIHRSVRDNARCKEKYGSAWDRYCNRVRYVLVPKVY